MFDWIIDNKEWLFSGVGILLFTSLLASLRFFKRRRNPKRQIIFKGHHEWARGAGRLQVPRDYLEEFRIGDRARLELTDEGILIRPAVGREAGGRATEGEEWDVQVSGLYVAEDEPPEAGHRKAMQWIRRRLSRSEKSADVQS